MLCTSTIGIENVQLYGTLWFITVITKDLQLVAPRDVTPSVHLQFSETLPSAACLPHRLVPACFVPTGSAHIQDRFLLFLVSVVQIMCQTDTQSLVLSEGVNCQVV